MSRTRSPLKKGASPLKKGASPLKRSPLKKGASPLKKEFWRPESNKVLVRRNRPWSWTINWSALTKKAKGRRR